MKRILVRGLEIGEVRQDRVSYTYDDLVGKILSRDVITGEIELDSDDFPADFSEMYNERVKIAELTMLDIIKSLESIRGEEAVTAYRDIQHILGKVKRNECYIKTAVENGQSFKTALAGIFESSII